MTKEITTRQLAILCSVSLFALKLVALPSLLYERCNESSIITFIISLVVEIVVLIVFVNIMCKYKDKSLYEITKQYLGGFVAKTIYVLIIIFYAVKLTMLINESVFYTNEVLDEDAKVIFFMLTFLPIIIAMSYNGLRSMSRTIEFGFPFILIGFIFCLFLSQINFTANNIGPIFRSISTSVTSLSNFSFWFSDFMFILIFADKVKLENKPIKKILKYVISTIILLTLLYFIYYRLYRITAFLHKDILTDVTQYKRTIGNVGDIDIIAILVYLFIIYFQGAIYFSSITICFDKITGDTNRMHSHIFTTIMITIIELFLLNNLEKSIDFGFNFMSYYTMGLRGLIFIFCVCLLFVKKGALNGKKYKKSIYKT